MIPKRWNKTFCEREGIIYQATGIYGASSITMAEILVTDEGHFSYREFWELSFPCVVNTDVYDPIYR